MRAAIYNPYLDTLGGGERYTAAFVKTLLGKGWDVDVEWKDEGILKEFELRFGINIKTASVVESINRGDGYDLCFWISDGSIPTLQARKNILHFQFPFNGINGNSLLNRMKLFRISKVVCNSYFTKSFIDEEYGVNSVVIYPPVPVNEISPRKKENIILYIGRFSQLKQAKRQDVLVEVFKRLVKKDGLEWRFVIAGGTEVGAKAFVKSLKKSVGNYPIEIFESPDFNKIKSLYGRAKLFWSASGFGIKEKEEPTRVEHFGMSVVEAMAAGAVPVIFNAGGSKEIIEDGVNGYLWNTKRELRKIILKIVNDKNLWVKISKNALSSSKVYEYERFEAEIYQLLESK